MYEVMEKDIGEMQELVNKDKDKAFREIMSYLLYTGEGLDKYRKEYYNVINNI